MEEWRNVKDYEGIYQVSNFGRVKSVERDILRNGKYLIHIKEKIMYIGKRSGYQVVYLKKGNNKTSKQIHRLVAEAFIPNPENKPQVNHIDGNKNNNNVNNLEWCTAKENIQHAHNTGLMSKIKHNNKKVMQYDQNMNLLKTYVSLCSAEKETNVNHSNISKCCKGIYRQSGGYIWRTE